MTIGRTQNGHYLVVVHTSEWHGARKIRVRIISARKAHRQEIRDYEDAPR